MRYFKCAQCGGLKSKTGRCNLCGKLPVEPGWPNEIIQARRGDAEHRAQVAVVTWATLARAEFPELALLFAIPNGGHRNVIVAKKLKAEGVKAGVPDLFLPVARGGYHGLFIEMKAGKNRPSQEQLELMNRLVLESYRCAVCYSSADAESILRHYLRLPCTAVTSRGGMDHE